MTIETKYSIGEKVWYKYLEKIFHDKISNIHVEVDCLGAIHIEYGLLWSDIIKPEYELFSTKEELL